jgi:hypothetical protein
MVEREMGDCLVFKLATLALPIDANPYNHNPPMQEHSLYISDIAACLTIYLFTLDFYD